MNEGQAPVNFFTINGGNNTPDDYNMFNDSTGATTTENTIQQNINPGIKTESLDSQLKQTGMQIDNQMLQESKQAFVDSLSQSQYERMLEFKNAGYSFEASKSLLEQTMGVKGGGYRGEGFALNEPVGGKNSVRNRLNPIGKATETIDDLIQKIPDVDIRGSRSEKLRKKLENLTPEQRADYENQFSNLSSAMKKWYGNVQTYAEEMNKSFLDQLFGAEADLDYKGGPNAISQILNIPGSALKTASATVRGLTNPVDTLVMLKDLVATEEGREILKQRYGTLEGFAEALEKDPTGVASDALAVAEVGAGAVGWTAKAGGTATRLAGATRTADRLSRFGNESIRLGNTAGVMSDMNLGIPYEAGMNNMLGRMAGGNKASQIAGTYLSMTQRPIRTIWKGANPYGESYVFPGIENRVNSIVDRVKDNIQATATGLTPEVKDRIRNNPYVKEYRDRIEQMIQDEGAPMENQRIMEMPLQELGEELMRRLDEYEARIEDNGPAYTKLNALSREFNLQPAYANTLGVFAKNQISMDADGSLKFGNMILPTDMNPIQTAWNLIMNAPRGNMTARQYLNLRKQLSDLARYDSGTTSRGVKVIRELRNQVNQVARKEIPGLAKADDLYHRQTEELKKLRQGLVYQQGERKGQIRDNYYSILKNLGTQNRRQMAQRLENIYPDLSARVEAVNMLPKLAKAYQNSPQMMKNLFKTAGILGGLQGGGVIRATMSWLLGLVADELLAKPLGEKRRKVAIDELLNETSPEAQQKLAEIKSKYDAGVELTEQDRQTLALAIQEIIEDEAKYLDEQHLRNREEIQESAKNEQPKLPAPEFDSIAPDGTIRLARGVQVNNPETMKLTPKTKGEEIVNMQEELNVDRATAEGVADSIEDFLDEIGGDINGNVNPRTVNYEKFRTRSLEELMDNESIPQTEKDKIADILVKRGAEAEIKGEQQLDREYAYEINKLMEQEQRIGKVGKNKVGKEYANKQMRDREKKKEKLLERMMEDYKIDQQQATDKYAELEAKPIDFINNYKKSKNFAEEQAERIVLDRLIEERDKHPKFVRDMDEGAGIKRQEIINNELQNGYERQTTDYGDRFINKETGDKGVIKYNDGNVEAVFTERSWEESGLRDTLPGDTIVRFEGETETIPLSELRGDSDTYYQEVGKSNPDEKWITAEEGLSIRNFKDGRTVEEIMDYYGINRDIVDKIVTEKGENALGKYQDMLVELEKYIKEGTAPHELFHAVFDLVNQGRKEEILKLVMDRQGMNKKEANEWLADRFSEYFRTGEFDTTALPNGFKNKIKWFFNKVKEFINGMWRERRQVKKLFDDMIENKIETEVERNMISEIVNSKKGDNSSSTQTEVGGARDELPPTGRVTISPENASQIKKNLSAIKREIKDLDAKQFITKIKDALTQKQGSNYLTNTQDGDTFVLRVGDHSADSRTFKKKKQFTNNVSVVIQLIDSMSFKKNSKVDLVELVYDPKRLTTEKMNNIISALIDWIDTGNYTDRGYNYRNISTRDPEAYYQVQQKSLFDTDDPGNDYKMSDYSRINQAISDIYDKAIDIAKKNNYMWDAFLRQLQLTYSPDLEAWNNRLKEEGIDIDNQRLVNIYNEVKNLMNEPRAEFIIKYQRHNTVMNALGDRTEKIKEAPLDIPEEYGKFAQIKKQQDWTDLEKYMNKNTKNIDIMYKTYDPDVVEWKNNIQRQIVGGEEITITDLYNVKNMIEDHIKEKGTDVNKGVPDDPTIQLLLEKAQSMGKDKVGTYNKKQIKKVGEELDELIGNEVKQIHMYYSRGVVKPDFNSMTDAERKARQEQIDARDNAFSDFEEEFIYGLGETYNPDIEKWHDNLKKWFSKNLKKYEGFRGVKQYTHLVEPHQLNSLKAKIEELSKYSYDEIFNAFEGSETDMFMRAVKPRIDELQAKGVEKAVTNLVALSNLDVTNFEKLMKNFNGKDPMPSIAVMDVNVPHEVFGDVSIVFGRNTVDPKVDPANKIYGSDAWTPVFPSTKWVGGADYNKTKKFATDVVEEIRKRGVDLDDGSILGGNRIDAMNLKEDIASLIHAGTNREDGKNITIHAEGIAEDIIEEMKNDKRGDFFEENEGVEPHLYSEIANYIANLEEPRQVIPAEYFDTHPTYRNADQVAEDLSYYVSDEVRGYYDEGDSGLNRIQEDIKKVLQKWIGGGTENILDAIESDFGIDIQDPAVREIVDRLEYLEEGDRPVTPENVLEAMKKQRLRRETYPGEFEDMIEIEGTKLNDIEDVRRQNFAKVFHGDRTGDLGDLKTRYDRLVDTVAKDIMGADDFERAKIWRGIKQEIKWSYDTNIETFKDNLIEENPMWEAVPNEVLQRIVDVVEQGKKIPIRFSESKPERIVDLTKEVEYVLVPTKDKARVEKAVKGTPLEGKVVEYTPDTYSAPRSKKLKELQKKYGNVFFSMGGVVMPIAMLYLMIQQEEEGQA